MDADSLPGHRSIEKLEAEAREGLFVSVGVASGSNTRLVNGVSCCLS